jgi:hypothetical protein
MIDIIDTTLTKSIYPNYIYRRVNLVSGTNYLLFPIEYGYWYWLRAVRAKWPEVDAAGAVFAPELFIEINEATRVHQRAPVPLRLITSPASNGVQINAGGQMTATGPRAVKMLNEIRASRDNITIIITGQNATPFPAFVDILIMGYMIPDSEFINWRGSNDGD